MVVFCPQYEAGTQLEQPIFYHPVEPYFLRVELNYVSLVELGCKLSELRRVKYVSFPLLQAYVYTSESLLTCSYVPCILSFGQRRFMIQIKVFRIISRYFVEVIGYSSGLW